MKKILIFSLAYYPQVGGAEVAIKEITDRVDSAEVSFDMVTLRFGSESTLERVGNVEVHRIGGTKILFPLLAAVRAYRLHRTRHYDAWWAMMSYMLLPVVLLRMVGVRLPYALTLQEGDTYGHMFGRLRILPFLPLIRHGFRRAAVVQTISTHLAAWARRQGFAGPLEVVPNGVDTAHFAGERTPHEGVVLVTASRLVRKNGIDTVIRALPLLPEVRFVVLGTGPDEQALKSLAEELGVAGRVEFAGFVPHAELPAHLHAADIFVRPSRSEGMGNSFIEAFAAGVPVIATQEGGIADFLFDAKRNPEQEPTGWAVDKDAPEQIAAAVKEIVADPARVGVVVANARRLAQGHYDWGLVAQAMQEKVFKRVLVK